MVTPRSQQHQLWSHLPQVHPNPAQPPRPQTSTALEHLRLRLMGLFLMGLFPRIWLVRGWTLMRWISPGRTARRGHASVLCSDFRIRLFLSDAEKAANLGFLIN